MSNSKTLYISDLDGTLLNSSASLSEATRDTLNTLIDKGIHFSVATARTLSSTQKILDGLRLRLPVALMNGALLYDMAQQRYTRVNSLNPTAASEIIKALRQFNITAFMYRLKDGVLLTYHESNEPQPVREFIRQRIARYSASVNHAEGFGSGAADDIIYFSLLDTRPQLLPFYDALSQLTDIKLTFYEDNYQVGLWYLEVFSPDASKQNAVEYLREMYGFERVIGFGDNLNDLPMFCACDIRIAVENAKLEVKTAADFICGGNDDDGVARWLEEHVL